MKLNMYKNYEILYLEFYLKKIFLFILIYFISKNQLIIYINNNYTEI